eukprot:scaffold413033_cov15-Prasinocladus_malaysianus.AAC.1
MFLRIDRADASSLTLKNGLQWLIYLESRGVVTALRFHNNRCLAGRGEINTSPRRRLIVLTQRRAGDT